MFEWHLRDMNVNSEASRTYRLLADICRTYSLCAACLCLQSYFWVRRILWLLKMTEKQDQWICIKFCFQLGKTSSETIQMMQKAFGYECMSKTRIKEWYNRFKGGRTSVDSDSCSGRPSTTKTLDNIERVRLAIKGDRRLTVRELENDLGIPKTTVWEILNKFLGITRVCAVCEQFLSKHSIALLRQPPYSRDIAPCDFWLFPKLKKPLKGQQFYHKTTVENNATSVLKAIPKSEFQDCFEKGKHRWNRVIQSSGDYFEGCHPPDDEE